MTKSQLSYYLLVWMFCSMQSNSIVNRVQERASILKSNDQDSVFQLVYDKCNEFSGHQTFMIEMYKIINQIAPPIMNSLFVHHENTQNICNYQILSNNIRQTVRCDLETISYRLYFFWQIYHKNHKNF